MLGPIIIGCRGQLPPRYNEFHRQMADRERIVIHSYDRLFDVARSNRSASNCVTGGWGWETG